MPNESEELLLVLVPKIRHRTVLGDRAFFFFSRNDTREPLSTLRDWSTEISLRVLILSDAPPRWVFSADEITEPYPTDSTLPERDGGLAPLRQCVDGIRGGRVRRGGPAAATRPGGRAVPVGVGLGGGGSREKEKKDGGPQRRGIYSNHYEVMSMAT